MRKLLRFAAALLALVAGAASRAAEARATQQLTCEQTCLVLWVGCVAVTASQYCAPAYNGCMYGCQAPH
jgi:hypothetical protein